jgi:hypothetical protein
MSLLATLLTLPGAVDLPWMHAELAEEMPEPAQPIWPPDFFALDPV